MPELSHTKNMLRICEADICQKVKNTEPQTKKHYSYKKKSVYCRLVPGSMSASLFSFISKSKYVLGMRSFSYALYGICFCFRKMKFHFRLPEVVEITSFLTQNTPNLPKNQSNASILWRFYSKRLILAPVGNWRWELQWSEQVFEIPNNWSSLWRHHGPKIPQIYSKISQMLVFCEVFTLKGQYWHQ